MKSKPGEWTFEDLNKFLANPRAFIPGTSMAFIGLNRPSERGDVIAYLNTLSDNPKPLPKAEAPARAETPAPKNEGQPKAKAETPAPKNEAQPKAKTK